MNYSSEQAGLIFAEVTKLLGGQEVDSVKLRQIWRMIAYFRGCMLATLVHNTIGGTVHTGPFQGMRLIPDILTGAFGPHLLGTYEHELHPVMERVIAHPYKHILNIGCSFGYYAVGLARRMPEASMHAFDISEDARQKCHALAALNHIEDRITIGGEFHGEDFAAFAKDETLVLMDIEGAEMQLLDPERYPALKQMDVIVEMHDIFDPQISDRLVARCTPTHDIEVIRGQPLLFDFKSIAGQVRHIDPFDSLIVAWENRDGPTPWAFSIKNHYKSIN